MFPGVRLSWAYYIVFMCTVTSCVKATDRGEGGIHRSQPGSTGQSEEATSVDGPSQVTEDHQDLGKLKIYMGHCSPACSFNTPSMHDLVHSWARRLTYLQKNAPLVSSNCWLFNGYLSSALHGLSFWLNALSGPNESRVLHRLFQSWVLWIHFDCNAVATVVKWVHVVYVHHDCFFACDFKLRRNKYFSSFKLYYETILHTASLQKSL